jgi:hypothetical protein
MQGCVVTDLTVHSKHNCYKLDAATMERIQTEVAVSANLEPGTNVIKIRSGSFNAAAGDRTVGEPLVMLWIYGGKFINQKTGVEVSATWSSLNGYDDTLTLTVLEPATLCAFFFDSHTEDNQGEVRLSVVRI